jgi:hypothetical protein
MGDPDGRQHHLEVDTTIRRIDRSRPAAPCQAELTYSDCSAVARTVGGDYSRDRLAGFGRSGLARRFQAQQAGLDGQLVCDPTARAPVAIRVRNPAHPEISIGIVAQRRRRCK